MSTEVGSMGNMCIRKVPQIEQQGPSQHKSEDSKSRLADKWAYFEPYFYTAEGIDKLSRVIFPTLFIAFNVIYWPYYSL